MLKIGEINKLKVLRETDIGYMLESKNTEVFLHKNDSNFLNLEKGTKVDAFLYYDNQGRLAATLKTPFIVKGERKFLTVVSVLNKLGVFLNIGINKDLLLSKDDLPKNFSQWPEIGSNLYVELVEKGSRLVAKMVLPTQIASTNELEIDETYDFYVIHVGEQGINLFNENKELLFVHKTLMRKEHYLGEKVTAKVINLTDKGYLGTLIEQKEIVRFDDAELIMKALEKYGKIPLTAKSSSEEVTKFFNLSRKAFKRALGHLYKENKVTFTERETILVKGDKNE